MAAGVARNGPNDGGAGRLRYGGEDDCTVAVLLLGGCRSAPTRWCKVVASGQREADGGGGHEKR
ncbi:hypothetical protein SESBI_48242 [Sesbania bispinosa]|nr:hypothetical protein SESBI_48242 [Sesbania bispinosa]